MAIKDQPLWYKMYFLAEWTDIVRLVGYDGMTYRDFSAGLQKLVEKYGRKAEAASWHLVVFEGQNATNVAPLAKVTLRLHVRKLAWQLLGPPPEHPEYARSKSPEPWVPTWARPAPAQEQPRGEKPKKRTRKKAA